MAVTAEEQEERTIDKDITSDEGNRHSDSLEESEVHSNGVLAADQDALEAEKQPSDTTTKAKVPPPPK